jgi:geranylgeranyl diphosphate synthase type II
MMTEALRAAAGRYRERVDEALDRCLPNAKTHPCRLHEAMRYAVIGGGKRIRPLLVYASGEALGVDPGRLDGPACAVELIHAYSLVHDDLPAMDDDDLRRGRPTCHRAFDEATALLAGDALQSLAFYILAHDAHMVPDPGARLRMIETLAAASGSRGMAGGQAIDLEAVGKKLSLTELEGMHIHKTGALIRACVQLGALSYRDIDAEQIERLDHYAKCIGLAFQIQDDILDVTGDTEILGKRQGADIALDKPTYPALLGLEGARERARDLYNSAVRSLDSFDQRARLLRDIAAYIVERDR